MKKPMSEKTPEMHNAIEKIFPGTKAAIEEHKCPTCSQSIGKFSNAISEREYEISGMGPTCQDKTFGKD